MKKLYKSFLFEGLLMIALGIIMLIWPEQTRNVLIIIIGAMAAAAGLLRILLFFANKSGNRNALDLIIGLIELALGIFLIVKPSLFASMISVVIGVILAYGALVLFIYAIRSLRGQMCVLAIIFALLLAALAVIIILNPAAFATSMTLIRGIALIVEGILLIIFMARRLK